MTPATQLMVMRHKIEPFILSHKAKLEQCKNKEKSFTFNPLPADVANKRQLSAKVAFWRPDRENWSYRLF
jgi:hypothetical protein